MFVLVYIFHLERVVQGFHKLPSNQYGDNWEDTLSFLIT